MRSPGMHDLVAASQLGVPVRLKICESGGDAIDDEIANYLQNSFICQPWFPSDIGSTLLSIDVEVLDSDAIDAGRAN